MNKLQFDLTVENQRFFIEYAGTTPRMKSVT